MDNLEIGIVVEVKGFISKIATFDNTNHATFIHNGNLIKNVSVNSFVIISQGFIKIVARINSETIWDINNNIKEYNLDQRFSKSTIKRVLEVQTIGYIKQNKFYSGASFLPMIGNLCSIPNNEDINKIYINNYAEQTNGISIDIGKSLIEQNMIQLPVNLFFASHIGIFGNTGSGKSNTLHKLYYELFSLDNLPNLKMSSSFLVLDFNGEYIQDRAFGISKEDKNIYELNSSKDSSHKFPIETNTFFDVEMLSILFSATTQTQMPFLSRIVSGMNKYGYGMNSLSTWVISLIRRVFSGKPNADIKERLVHTLKSNFPDITELLNPIIKALIFSRNEKASFAIMDSQDYFDGDWCEAYEQTLNIREIASFLEQQSINLFQEFQIRCELRLIHDMLYGNVIPDHIDPLIKRIYSRLNSIKKYIKLVRNHSEQKFLQIVSLKNLNQDAKKILSLLICKMYFDQHKRSNTDNKKSLHLIIDEAHNILSTQSAREQDNWKDYRLDLFEEIIKEGRKFSFFLTLSSQRPADISPTILSQVHNFFLHKLVNERDLQIIDNSISTMDKISKSILPILAQGVCIVSGTAVSMPIIVNVDYIEDVRLRPKSDTILLTDIWSK